jgi:hypothetical protein
VAGKAILAQNSLLGLRGWPDLSLPGRSGLSRPCGGLRAPLHIKGDGNDERRRNNSEG